MFGHSKDEAEFQEYLANKHNLKQRRADHAAGRSGSTAGAGRPMSSRSGSGGGGGGGALPVLLVMVTMAIAISRILGG